MKPLSLTVIRSMNRLVRPSSYRVISQSCAFTSSISSRALSMSASFPAVFIRRACFSSRSVQILLPHCPCRAVDAAHLFLHSAHASPHGGPASVVVPFHPAVDVPAVLAENDAGKSVSAAVRASAVFKMRPSLHLFLDHQKDVLRDDGFVAVFHVVLRRDPVIVDLLLRKEIDGITPISVCCNLHQTPALATRYLYPLLRSQLQDEKTMNPVPRRASA